MDKNLSIYLEKNKISYKIHKHKPLFKVEDSRNFKSQIPGLHCKTLFLKDENENFYLVGMPAEKKLDSKKFREVFSIKKIKFASPEELKEINLVPGSVSIFGAIYFNDEKSNLVIYREVWDSETVGFHPNENTSTLEITKENFRRFYNSLNCNKRVVEI